MTTESDSKTMLAAYDQQMRARMREVLPAGMERDWDGPLLRRAGGPGNRGFVDYKSLVGLTDTELDALIARQVDYFRARGEKFEWKTYSHDWPEDLPARLVAAGFVAEDVEALVMGPAAPMADDSPQLPSGVSLRQTTDRADFDRIAAMNTEVWGEDLAWLADMIAGEIAQDPESMVVYLAEAEGQVVSAAWARINPGSDFLGLWGGTTVEAYRGRGIYRALVAVRAALAVRLGYRYLQVDASPDSRPILERLGLTVVSTTTPYIWQPASTPDGAD